MKKPRQILLVAILCFLGCSAAQAQSISIKECKGRLTICLAEGDSLYELCVKVTPGTCPFKTFSVNWGDGQTEAFNYSFSTEIELKHRYNLRAFVRNCQGDTDVSVNVKTDCATGDNNGFLLTFKNAPRVNFRVTNACEGQNLSIRQESCPNSRDITYTWDYGNGRTSTGFSPNFTLPQGATDYNITLKASSATCGNSERTVSGKIQKKPEAKYTTTGLTIQNQDTVVCLNNGGVLTMDGTISIDKSRYRWTITGGKYSFIDRTNSGLGVVKIQFEETATYTVTLVVENDCGTSAPMICGHRVVDTRTVQLPKLDFICEQPYRYRIPTPVVGAVYAINGQPLTDPSTGIDLMFSTTPYVVEARLQGPCGLQIERDTFTVNAPQAVRISRRDTSVCVNSAAFALNTNLAGGAWVGSNINPQTGIFTPRTVGIFKIKYNRGTGRCTASDSVTITVQGVQTTATDVGSCAGAAAIKLVGSPAGGRWTTTDCSNCIRGDSLFLVNVAATRLTVRYEFANAIGCAGAAQATVTIGRPKAEFTVRSVCKDSLALITNASQGATSFQWFLGNNAQPISPDRVLQLRNLPVGQSTIRLVASTGTCRDSASQQVTITAPPAPISFAIERSSDCAPVRGTIRINAPQRADVQYSWSLPSGAFSGYQPPVQTFDNNTRTPRTFTTSVSSRNGCGVQTATQSLSVRPPTTAEIGIDSTTFRCTPAKIKFSNRSTGHTPSSTLWYFGDGTAPVSSLSDTLIREFSTRDSARTVRIRLVVRGDCGSDTDQVFIRVFPTIVKPFITLPLPACPNESVQFRDATTPKPDRWLWKFGNEGTSTLANPTFAFKLPNTSYTVTLIAYTFCGYDSVQRVYRTTELPRADFSIGAPFSCVGAGLPLTNLSSQNNTFLWNFGNGSLDSTRRNPAPVFQTEGTKAITLTVYGNSKSCKNEVQKSATIRPRVRAAFSVDGATRICSPGPVVLRSTSQNATRYEWRLSNGLTTSTEQPSFVLPPGRYDVTLKATYEGICLDSTQQIGAIQMDSCAVTVPQAFTPNGDGQGDLYTVFGEGIERIVSMKIRNRAGIVVFETYDVPAQSLKPDEAWDGTYQGRPMPVDMYVVEVTATYFGGRRQTEVANIYLVR